ncbi:hypothetical protein CTEN210_17563 [Chaetoceros tenuissimus]|uniref:DUF6824 domain-containing protein n=1 Tax=Chaetoceros tenuissimus TaxID=426638 RepID=A0AAD3DBS4_9STRA|nr:hypothetical protein CTEN210_17563 [Chaetoceros tenuissimus]
MSEQRKTQNITYTAGDGPLVRIRNPTKEDVLCGRGGGINAHEGNVAFRQMVHEQKERYNVAANKQEKAEISQQIVDQIKEKGGRFLQKDDSRGYSSSGSFWVEIDNMKAIAKTSQALREGAPSIRAKAARSTTSGKKNTGKRSRKSTSSKQASAKRARSRSRSRSNSPHINSIEKQQEEKEDNVIHPLIRGYHDGIHRGKQLIPVAQRQAQELCNETNTDGPEREPTPYPENAPTPPPQDIFGIQGPSSTTITPIFSSPQSYASIEHMDHYNLPLLSPPLSTSSRTKVMMPEPLKIMDPSSSLFTDDTKPDITCARSHSLALSEVSEHEAFVGNEAFSDPFANEEKMLKTLPQQIQPPAVELDRESSNPSVSSINRVLRNKSSDTTFSRKHKSGDEGSSGKSRSEKQKIQTLRSFMSELSDIPNETNSDSDDEEFHEGLKKIYDATHPSIASPKGGDTLPTHLIPTKYLYGATPIA